MPGQLPLPADHDGLGLGGCFVWADASVTGAAQGCGNPNQFVVRSWGGVVLSVGPGAAGCTLSPATEAWSCSSDRNLKANFADVDGRAILDALASIPIQTWNYRTPDVPIRHIGPTAQDFAAAFGVGEDDTHISTVDADGVAFAAIQGLYQLAQEQDAQLAALEKQNAALEARLAALEQAVAPATAR